MHSPDGSPFLHNFKLQKNKTNYKSLLHMKISKTEFKCCNSFLPCGYEITNGNSINHTEGRNISGAVFHLPLHSASSIMDYHTAGAHTGRKNLQVKQ